MVYEYRSVHSVMFNPASSFRDGLSGSFLPLCGERSVLSGMHDLYEQPFLGCWLQPVLSVDTARRNL